MGLESTQRITGRTTIQGSGATQTASRTTEAFTDPEGINPRPDYLGKPTTTFDTYSGGKILNTFGADIPADTIDGEEAEYGKNYSYHTPAGHIVEYNDTPGSERIMIRHKSGTGINIGPDGSVMISSKRRVDVMNENHYVSVAGDGTMSYEGNLTLNVSGDFNVNVGGEYNVTSTKHSSTVNGPSSRIVYGDDNHTIRGNQSTLTTGGAANTYLEGLSTIVKGDSRYAVEGNMTMATSQTLIMTSDKEVVMTSPEANIAADNLSVFGDEGTIGGENMQMYTKNLRANQSIYATTSINTHSIRATRMDATVVHADLEGNARTATTAGTSLHQSYADGTFAQASGPGVSFGGSYTAGLGTNPNYTVATADLNDDDETETALPTATLLEDYRTKGSKGVRKVQIDPENFIKDSIDLTTKTGGVTDRALTKEEVRAKMRDPNNRNNSEFTGKMVSQGLLSPDFAKSSPPNINSVKSTKSTVIQGQTPLGSVDPSLTAKRLKGS